MTIMLQLPVLLKAAGINVRTLDGWKVPRKSGRYKWRSPDGEPAANMHHHTAGSKYTPNRDKANGYAGLSYLGSARLYQERYEGSGYEAVYTIANAHPAPISSGAGDFGVLEKVRNDIEVIGRQGPDTPNWYGNTYYWNDEWVLDGIGSWVDQEVFAMMVVICQVKNELMDWNENNHISHGHHTRRKVDLWAGQFSNTNRDGFDKTVQALRASMTEDTPILPPIPDPEEDEMKLGDTGTNVQKWQNYLNRWNEEHNVGQVPLIEDGIFGPGTQLRTVAFQGWSNIEQSGTVGSMDTGTMAIVIKIRTGS